MILWTIKLLNTVRKAIAGRKYPHQLAWAAAFGLLLGIVPHGNLLAVGLLVVVLSLKINHAMAGLTAIATAFLLATRLDPIAHMVGETVLTHPRVSPIAVTAWQLPLVPWTDLNNTVVMGSLLIGSAALIPVFIVTYPIFRLLAPKANAAESELVVTEFEPFPADARKNGDRANQVVLVDRGHDHVTSPHTAVKTDREDVSSGSVGSDQQNQDPESCVAVETRIDVIRMKDDPKSKTGSVNNQSGTAGQQASKNQKTDEQPMDEALNYLLRQLRDSQQRSAA
jgi:uncharacterized protein (TIGR03546 family)